MLLHFFHHQISYKFLIITMVNETKKSFPYFNSEGIFFLCSLLLSLFRNSIFYIRMKTGANRNWVTSFSLHNGVISPSFDQLCWTQFHQIDTLKTYSPCATVFWNQRFQRQHKKIFKKLKWNKEKWIGRKLLAPRRHVWILIDVARLRNISLVFLVEKHVWLLFRQEEIQMTCRIRCLTAAGSNLSRT